MEQFVKKKEWTLHLSIHLDVLIGRTFKLSICDSDSGVLSQ